MRYDFDEIIDRKGTGSENVEGFRSYMFPDDPDIELPVPDDELIRMWVADMEFAVAPEICDAVRRRVDRRIFGYTGVFGDEYHRIFSAWCRERYDWDIDSSHLVFSPGIIPALYGLCGDLTGPADSKALFLAPAYGFFRHACRYNGRGYICSDIVRRDGCFRIDFDDLEEKASRPDTGLVIWCNPHNPSGRMWNAAEAARAAKIFEDNGLWVISDEIHCDIIRTGNRHIPMARLMPGYDRLITCMAPSKTFNMAGMMFSNIIIPDDKVRRSFVRRNKLGGAVNPLSFEACRAAYEKGGAWLEEMKLYLDENFRYAADMINRNIKGAVCSIPEATYLLWVDMRGCGIPEKDLSVFFAKEAGVLVESGDRLFVQNAEGFVRLNLAMPRSMLSEGLRRMADAVSRCASAR